MKVDYISDIHADFYYSNRATQSSVNEFYKKLVFKKGKEPAEVLIIAGDLSNYNEESIKALKAFSLYYKKVLFVLGNHDYYSERPFCKSIEHYLEKVTDLKKSIKKIKNVHLLDGDVIKYKNIRFGGCGAWYNRGYIDKNKKNLNLSDLEINKIWKNSLSDYKMISGIKSYDDIWKVEEPKLNRIYKKCDVMITHVSPSADEENIAFQYRGNNINTFFTFDGDKYLKEGSMKYWIYGHTHSNIKFTKHGVNCLCNSVGYPYESENMTKTRIETFEIEKEK